VYYSTVVYFQISIRAIFCFLILVSLALFLLLVGIGLELTKQLCKNHSCKVFLGSRNAERGAQAVATVKEYCGSDDAPVSLIVIDVASDESVKAAAASLQSQSVKLDAIVNNAGVARKVTDEDIIDINYRGVKRVVDNFFPLLDGNKETKIVNVGSGAGPMYVAAQSDDRKRVLCNPDITLEEIDDLAKAGCPPDDPVHNSGFAAYSLSKALVYAYTIYTAKTFADKNVISLSLTPGLIATGMILEEMRARAKPVEEGTVSLLHCLFEATKENNGWFYGSDAKRSPPHFVRNPGEPEFDGTLPWY
jgi:carbonyl reductase 1